MPIKHHIDPIRIAIVAGEESGDYLGAQLMAAIKQRLPNVQFFGIGGKHMGQQGLTSLFPLEDLAVCGYIEVLKNLPKIWKIYQSIKRTVLKVKPDLYIGIDAPDFNLRLEKALKNAGIPTVHYVGPSVWMWRRNRIKKIHQAVSHLLLIFPFEKAIWQRSNVSATYTGHPLADQFSIEAEPVDLLRSKFEILHHPIIALLPGSRLGEVQRLSDILIETAKQIYTQHPNVLFLIPFANKLTLTYFINRQYACEASELPIRVMLGNSREALKLADVVAVASGTATLEAMLAKKPLIIFYKINKITYWLVKNKFYLPYFGLPNILAGRFIVPEFIQHEATAKNIAQAINHYLSDPRLRQKLIEKFTKIHYTLRHGAAKKAAEAIFTVIKQRQYERENLPSQNMRR